MIQIKNCTVTLLVSDLTISIQFYLKVLGMKLVKKYGEHYAEVAGPGLLIGLHPTEKNIDQGNGLSIGFSVSNLDLEIKNLKEMNFDIGIRQDGPIRLVSFKDPDNNHLFLTSL